MKNDRCFAEINLGSCNCLTNTHCNGHENCPFYKTATQMSRELVRSEARLLTSGRAEAARENHRLATYYSHLFIDVPLFLVS